MGNIVSKVFQDQESANQTGAKLWCSWVVFRIEPTSEPTELSHGGIGFGHEACRKHVRQVCSRRSSGPASRSLASAKPEDLGGGNKRTRAVASFKSTSACSSAARATALPARLGRRAMH
jgi:hypothetical protein